MASKIDMAIDFLKLNPGIPMKTREIAKAILEDNIEHFKDKIENPKFNGDINAVISQIAAELGKNLSQDNLDKKKSGVMVDNNRPRTFIYHEEYETDSINKPENYIDLIYQHTKSNAGTQFSMKELATLIFETFPERHEKRVSAPNFGNRDKVITSIAASLGKQFRSRLTKSYPKIKEHNTSPVTVSWSRQHAFKFEKQVDHEDDDESDSWDGKEESLYPIFNKFLHENHRLYPMRIDEKRSKNQRGKGGNEWLYPDIVALHPMEQEWSSNIRQCANLSYGEVINLWSFEVKKSLTTGNVRKCYFQAVSNSSWANYGYLVATTIDNEDVLRELKMLHALHGIGVMLMDPVNPGLTKTILPAEKREKIDWFSANRLAEENRDFMEFTTNTSDYLQTKRLKIRDWHTK